MPALPKREDRVRTLVRRGIMPSVAERIVAECEEDKQRILSPTEAAMRGNVTEADVEQARLWWYYSPDVPQRWRRILDARKVGSAKP